MCARDHSLTSVDRTSRFRCRYIQLDRPHTESSNPLDCSCLCRLFVGVHLGIHHMIVDQIFVLGYNIPEYSNHPSPLGSLSY